MHKLPLDLRTHKATGPDSIPAFVLKAGADQLSPILTRLHKYFLDTGEIPGDWKNAYIQYNLNGSNTDGSFTVADLNSFFSPYKILPIAQENTYLGIFFLSYLGIVCFVYSLESPHRRDSNEYIQHTIRV